MMDPIEFIHDIQPGDIPVPVLGVMKRSVLDTIGVAAVGSATEISAITRAYAKAHWANGPDAPYAQLMFDGSSVSPVGAAFAGAYTIDSIDGHDGHSPVKGHAGSAVFPALLGFCQVRRQMGKPVSNGEFLAAKAVGYEIAYRSGLAQHATTTDYHTSGAWTAIGVAAMGARLLGLTADQTRQAIGIAEYHGPRSQMMRCIDHPTMLRDGVGWGAPVGVSAVYLAKSGFTGAPAITVEADEAAGFWSDLAERWEISNTHYKRYPVCRWAHPAIDAARELMQQHNLTSQDIERVRIQTFHNAIRLAGHDPKSMDELAYGIAFPTAIMIVKGKIGPAELSPEILEDDEIRRISLATQLVETEHYNRISVGVRWADVTLYLHDGRSLQSEPRKPKGDPDDPLSDNEISEKFHLFADGVIGWDRANAIEAAVSSMDACDGQTGWIDELVFPAIETALQ